MDKRITLILLTIVALSSCIDEYEISDEQLLNSGLNSLYIDGRILVGAMSYVYIEEPISLNSPDLAKFVENATVTLIGDNTAKDFFWPNRMKWTTICIEDNGQNIQKQKLDGDRMHNPQIIISNFYEVPYIIFQYYLELIKIFLSNFGINPTNYKAFPAKYCVCVCEFVYLHNQTKLVL